MKKTLGFSLTELVMVIVTIGILSCISLISYAAISDRTKTTKAVADLNNLVEIINNAKGRSGKALWQITQEYAYSQGNMTYDFTWNDKRCTITWRNSNSLSTDLRNIPDSDPCAIDMRLTWAAVYQAAYLGISEAIPRDAWGSPYMLDSNEDEASGDNFISHTSIPVCSTDKVTWPYLPDDNNDTIQSAGPNGISQGWNDDVFPTKKVDRVICLNVP